MITLQHSLCDLIKEDGNIEAFEKEIPYCLLPDAIRAYIGPRQYSHFEENPDGNDISWYQFPENIKIMTKESLLNQPKHLANISRKSCLGEYSHIDEYIKRNANLPEKNYKGILIHLIQDHIFDAWIRRIIDCINKYEPNAEFYFEGKIYDSNGIRDIINQIEEYGVYILSFFCYKKYGIVTNQDWFDNHVKKVLEKEYPLDIAYSTYKYMKIPYEINEWITQKDWSHLDEVNLYKNSYYHLYNEIDYYTRYPSKFMEQFYKNKWNNKIDLNRTK